MFGRRHYQALAKLVQGLRGEYDPSETRTEAFNDVERALADMFAADNPGFQRDLFLQACKPGADVTARKVAS